MALQEMYPGFVNSVETTLIRAINATETVIDILDDTKIPEAPNLLVIGGADPSAETVKITKKEGTKITVVRGFEGKAKAWDIGSTVARNFTNADYQALMNNINALDAGKANYYDGEWTNNSVANEYLKLMTIECNAPANSYSTRFTLWDRMTSSLELDIIINLRTNSVSLANSFSMVNFTCENKSGVSFDISRLKLYVVENTSTKKKLELWIHNQSNGKYCYKLDKKHIHPGYVFAFNTDSIGQSSPPSPPELISTLVCNYPDPSIPRATTENITKTVELADLQAELAALPKVINHTVTLNVNEGEHSSKITIENFTGTGEIIINGAAAKELLTHKVYSLWIQYNTLRRIVAKGLTAANTSNTSFYCYRCSSRIILQYCNTTGGDNSLSGFYGVNVTECSNLEINNCMINSMRAAIFGNKSKVYVDALSGTGSFYGYYVQDDTVIVKGSEGTLTASTLNYIQSPNKGGQIINPDGSIWNTTAAKLKNYNTTNSASGNSGKYTKIATLNLYYQYQDAIIKLDILGIKHGTASIQSAELTFKVKQQTAMSGNPLSQLICDTKNGTYFTYNNFIAVLVENMATKKAFELYYKPTTNDTIMSFTRKHDDETGYIGGITFFSSQPFIDVLPSGEQITCNDISSYTKTEADAKFAPVVHPHTKSQISDFPTSMPASDVAPWAKALVKPTYNLGELSNYSEGLWTPRVSWGTLPTIDEGSNVYNRRIGKFWKFGDLTILYCYIYMTSRDASKGTSNLTICGIPTPISYTNIIDFSTAHVQGFDLSYTVPGRILTKQVMTRVYQSGGVYGIRFIRDMPYSDGKTSSQEYLTGNMLISTNIQLGFLMAFYDGTV